MGFDPCFIGIWPLGPARMGPRRVPAGQGPERYPDILMGWLPRTLQDPPNMGPRGGPGGHFWVILGSILGPPFWPLLAIIRVKMWDFAHMCSKRGPKMDPKMDPKMAPGALAQGAQMGVPGQKPLIFTSRMAKTPDLGPGPWALGQGPYTTVYRGNSPIWPLGPWPRGPFLYVHSGEIEKRPTFAVVATT